MTPQQKTLHLTIQSALALAHLLPLLFLLFQRQEEKASRVFLFAYCALSTIWGLAVAIATYGSAQVAHIANYASIDLPVLLVAMLVSIAYQKFDRHAHWVWGAVGATWSVAAIGLQALLGPGTAGAQPATTVAVIGWLIFSCFTIALSAHWTLRAPLTIYRNRGLYYLGLLIPLLTGQSLILIQYRWREIALILHLLGTAGIIAYATADHLPNIKNLLRNSISYIILTVATALLYLLGLLAIQPLLLMQTELYITLIGAIFVAVMQALIHQPFYRFVDRTVNRFLWKRDYDPAQTIREYGRTISNVIDMELLATLALGTIHEALEIERGALMVAFTTEGHVSFRVLEGFGKTSREKVTLTVHSPILSHIASHGEPLFQYDLEHHPELQKAPAKEKKQLGTLGMEIYLPILTQERLLGLLALGPLKKGEPYSPQEVAMLTTLAQQTAAALENARFFDKLRTLNAEITQLHEDLQQAYQRLKRLDQAKSDFLSISSHELRTPLTVIQGYTDILEELANNQTLTPGQVSGIIKSLKEAIKRMTTIVTAMLDASAVEMDTLGLHFTSTTLQGVMSMAIKPWREAIDKRQIALTVTGIDDIPSMTIDVQRLCQAFSNIISNAIKYTPDGGQVSIQANLTDDNEHVEVVIADTGVGIDPEDQDLIFEKFYRVGDLLLHSTGDTKFKGAGTGLGLHITRGVIEAHGGRIWVESEEHDEERCPGSTFHVLLPLKASPPPPNKRLDTPSTSL